MTGQALLAWATVVLREAGVADARRDAQKLLLRALGAKHIYLVDLTGALSQALEAQFRAEVASRAARKPMSQILGQREFFGRSFEVTSDVLDPRPDTETLIDVALQSPFQSVFDMGTGSGCILATLLCEMPNATGEGIDVSQRALSIAARNLKAHGLMDRATLRCGSWYDGSDETFDLIVSNPPYIAADEMAGLEPEVRDHEPRVALTDEGDGLSCYREIIGGSEKFLRPQGRLIVEIGPTQAGEVVDMMKKAGLTNILTHPDIDGRDRVVSGHK